MSAERSLLRVRERKHLHPDRQDEIVIEVIRKGKVIAFIYGSREGIHVCSDALNDTDKNRPFFFDSGAMPGVILPLLEAGDPCPWCDGDAGPETCPFCAMHL